MENDVNLPPPPLNIHTHIILAGVVGSRGEKECVWGVGVGVGGWGWATVRYILTAMGFLLYLILLTHLRQINVL